MSMVRKDAGLPPSSGLRRPRSRLAEGGMSADCRREHEQRYVAALHDAVEADRNLEAGAIFGAA